MEHFPYFQEEIMNHQEMPYWNFSPPPPLEPHHDLIPTALDLPPAPPPPPPPPVTPRSAFVRFTRPGGGDSSFRLVGGGKNIHMRVIEFLRRIPAAAAKDDEKKFEGGNRCFRHMMRERQRREKLSQSYADLHSMFAPRSKADKNSIVQCAAVYVRELKGTKEELRRRNEELRARIAKEGKRADGARIRLRVEDPSSPIDSMIGALRCLKGMGVKADTIQSSFCGRELSAAMDIETKIATTEVERAVQGVLMEVERKGRTHLPRTNALSQQQQQRRVTQLM